MRSLVVFFVSSLTLLAGGVATASAATCMHAVASIVGTAGDDFIVGTPAADVIATRAGDDVIRGLGGNDLICSGKGTTAFARASHVI